MGVSLFKLKRQTKPRKEKNESSTKSLTKKKKKKISPLAHSSAHSYPNIGKAPNLLFNIFQIQKQNKSVSYNYFVIFLCMHACRFLGFRLLLLLQLIPMATISISLFLLLCTVILFYCKLCFGRRYSKATG